MTVILAIISNWRTQLETLLCWSVLAGLQTSSGARDRMGKNRNPMPKNFRKISILADTRPKCLLTHFEGFNCAKKPGSQF